MTIDGSDSGLPARRAEVTVEPYALTISSPLPTARGTIETRRGFVVRVRTDEWSGLGEAAPLRGFTEPLDECERALDRASAVAASEGLDAALR